jgi:type II secretory pathway predicted ATPase ExeA
MARAHRETTLLRPVLVIDEAQEMSTAVLAELRLLVSAQFDSRTLLTVVLADDGRLAERFQTAELQPLASRIRVRLRLERASPQEPAEVLRHACATAGNPRLMTPELVTTLAEHAAGNLRIRSGAPTQPAGGDPHRLTRTPSGRARPVDPSAQRPRQR